jgi:hypothetical protein
MAKFKVGDRVKTKKGIGKVRMLWADDIISVKQKDGSLYSYNSHELTLIPSAGQAVTESDE